MKWSNYFIFSLIMLFAGCQGKSDFEHLIADDNSYWVLMPEKKLGIDSLVNLICFHFCQDKTIKTYLIDEDEGKLSLLHPSSDDKEWSYSIKDSVFIMRSFIFKSIRYKQDTIFLIYKDSRTDINNLNRGDSYILFDINYVNNFCISD